MFFCAAASILAWNRLFRPKVEWRWAVLLGILALAPVLPALRTGFVYGPFDTNVASRPWASRADLGYEPKVGRLNDVTLQFVPWQAEARRQMLSGRVPLLNPHSGAGQPLLGNGQSAPFSLVSLLALPFEPLRAQALRAFLKVLLALLGAFLAARQLDCRPAFSVLAAVAYAFGGSLSVWKLFPHAEVMALWPLAFLASERLLADPNETRSRLLLGLSLAGMFLAGHPETALAGCLALAARWLWAMLRGNRRAVGVLMATALLAALGTSFFLLPMAETVLGSEKFDRERSGGEVKAGGSAVGALANLAVPGLYGTPQGEGEAGPGPLQWLGEGVVGLPALALALAGLFAWRSRDETRTYLAVLAAAAFAIHLGLLGPIFALPLLSVFANRYFAYLGGFAVALLAARALEDLAEEPDRRLLPGSGIAALLVAGALAVHPQLTRHALAALAAAVGVAIVLLLVRRAPVAAGLLAAALTFGQLADAFAGYYPTIPAAQAYPPVPLLDALALGPRPFRLIGTRGVFVPNASTFYGLSDVRTHDPMEPARYVAWLHEVLDVDVSTYKKQYRTPKRRHVPFLRLLGTRFLLSGPNLRPGPLWVDRGLFRETRLWELPGEPRWAFFPETVVPVASARRAREVLLTARRLFKIASLEIEPGHETPTPNGKARVVRWKMDGDRLRIDTEVEEDAWLVIAQSALPGWTARADGRRARTAIADGALLAVQVPKETQAVSLRYQPRTWTIGLALSVAAWIVAAALLRRSTKTDP